LVETNPPELIVNVPFMVEAEPKFTPPFMLTLFKDAVPEIELLPEKLNTPSPTIDADVPELAVIVPLTERVLLEPIEIVPVPEPLKVIDPTLWFVVHVIVFPDGIIAISPTPGTVAPPAPPDVVDQTAEEFQFPELTAYLVATVGI
jgi:hypothetical protein